MVKFRSKNDLKNLYEIQDDGQELKGVIYSPKEDDECEDLILVFKTYTVTINEDGIVKVEKRYSNVREFLEAEKAREMDKCSLEMCRYKEE